MILQDKEKTVKLTKMCRTCVQWIHLHYMLLARFARLASVAACVRFLQHHPLKYFTWTLDPAFFAIAENRRSHLIKIMLKGTMLNVPHTSSHLIHVTGTKNPQLFLNTDLERHSQMDDQYSRLWGTINIKATLKIW